MKGDYWKITYRTGSGVAVETIQASRDGATVDATFPNRNEGWLTVEELNKAGNPILTARFSVADVISAVQGHEQIKRAAKRK